VVFLADTAGTAKDEVLLPENAFSHCLFHLPIPARTSQSLLICKLGLSGNSKAPHEEGDPNWSRGVITAVAGRASIQRQPI
jgi:hypothetical protein